MKWDLLTRSELADRLRVTPQAISSRLHKAEIHGDRGEVLPPSIIIGSRRFWLESDLVEWLSAKRDNALEKRNKRVRGRPCKTKE